MGKNLHLKDIQQVEVGTEKNMQEVSFEQALYGSVHERFETFKLGRQQREDIWLECWSMYLGSVEAREIMRARMLRHVGNVNNDWRHNITIGKAFEQVETIVAYLQQAFFPNRDWFDAVPHEPGHQEDAQSVKDFTKKKLQDNMFTTHWEMFLRQLAITGTSVMAMPWRYETKKTKKRVKVHAPKTVGGFKWDLQDIEKIVTNNHEFEVLDVYDVYFDPIASCPSKADLVRRVIKSKAEIAEHVESGYYKNLTKKQIGELEEYKPGDESTTNQSTVKDFQGIQDNINGTWHHKVEVFEYWGDVYVNGTCYKDVVVTWSSDKILRFENNPFWSGKPFIIGTYTPVVRSITALGAIEPSLGLLHEMDIITNQRLDNLELSVDVMWEHVDDGTLSEEDIYTQPGKVFTVSQSNTIKPIQQQQNFTITYEESNVLEQRIDKNVGTGNLISANTARSGERVTAAEVQATRDAGGNRLSGVHKHIEATALIPCLRKIFEGYQQFVVEDEVIRIPGENPGDFDFAEVGQEELQHEFSLMPVGADHIANKEYEVNQRLAFLQVVSANPQMSQQINYPNFMIDLARLMGIDDVEQFINAGGTMGQESISNPNESTPQTIEQQIAASQGNSEANAIAGEFKADGGASLMNDAFGVQTPNQL